MRDKTKVRSLQYLSLLLLHLDLAVTTDEICRRPRPGVLFALQTHVLCFAGIVNLKTIPDRRLTSEENGASLGG
jgi:hypothetical protein